jgi:copper oxidase (laccase) domain-containing protein
VKHILSDAGLCYFQFAQLAACPEGVHGIFTRLGGRSAAPFTGLNTSVSMGDDYAIVMENRRLMAQALGVDGTRFATVAQIHGRDVCIVGHDWSPNGALPKADILLTTAGCGYNLVMAFADCTPLLFYDRQHGVVALAHAGWRGTAQGVACHTVRALAA